MLAEPFLTGIGWLRFLVYTFSGDLGSYGTTCAEITARPLYLFAFEALAPTSDGGAVPVGNGNGIKAFGGTFSLVVNP